MPEFQKIEVKRNLSSILSSARKQKRFPIKVGKRFQKFLFGNVF
jgi:hypothetical protein